MQSFAVERTNEYVTRHRDRMITGNAPTLTIAIAAYKEAAVFDWLNSLVLDYSIYCGMEGKVNAYQIDSISQAIVQNYSHLKATEIMLFFSMMKGGVLRDKHGDDCAKMYGVFSGQAIMAAMKVFMEYRAVEIDKLERNTHKETFEAANAMFVQPLMKKLREEMAAKDKALKEQREKEKERLIKEHNEQFLKMLNSKQFISK